MTPPEGMLVLAIAIVSFVVQRTVRNWVGRQWAEQRIGNLSAVLLLLLTSGIGFGAVALVVIFILNPAGSGALGVLAPLLFMLAVFWLGMAAMNYAAAHGVREIIRIQRKRKTQSK